MRSLVKEYCDTTTEWLAARKAAPGGCLTDDEESEWVEKLDVLWKQMDENEIKMINNRLIIVK